MRKSTLSLLAAAMVASAGMFSARAVEYNLTPAPGAVTDLMTVELTFPNEMVLFYENSQIPVAVLENTTTGAIYNCQDADRNTHAEAMCGYTLTFIGEDEEEARAITDPGNYTLTIRAMYIPGAEGAEDTDFGPITESYSISYPVEYTLTPAAGTLKEISTISIEFPNNKNVEFYENNQMPVAVLENTTTGNTYVCQEPTRNTFVQSEGIVWDINFMAEGEEEVVVVNEPGVYTLTIKALALNENDELEALPVITAGYVIEYPVEYTLTPAAGTVKELTTISLEFPNSKNVEFYENNQMPVAVLENTTTGNAYVCQEATRNTRAESEGTVWDFTFVPEGEEEAVTVNEVGNYTLTIKALALNVNDELVDLPVIKAEYVIDYPVVYGLSPAPGIPTTDLMTVTIEFPETKNVAFYENNQMPVAVLENLNNGKIYNCQEATRNTHAETDGIVYEFTFIGEDDEEASPITEPGDYLLTIRALGLEEDGEITESLPVITANYKIDYPVNYVIEPLGNVATNLMTVTIEFPDNNNVEFYENNQMPVAVLENINNGKIYNCQEATRNTHAETEGIVYELTFIGEDDEEASAITEPGNYLLTIRALKLVNEEESVDLPVITKNYEIVYPVDYVIEPFGNVAADLMTVTIEFPNNKNVEFYENNQMPVAVLENLTNGKIYNCQEADRDTFAETEGILYTLTFIGEDDEEASAITEPGNYLLTIRALKLVNEEESEDLPVITKNYEIVYPVNYIIEPLGNVASNLKTVSIEFPDNKNVEFYENNQMPVAVLENLTNGKVYNCQEADRDTFAETDGILYTLTFVEEDAEEASDITEPGSYLLTIRALKLVDGEEETELPVITKGYDIPYPYFYLLNPGNGAEVSNLSTVSIEFPSTKVAFYENNQMPVAVLENKDTEEVYVCYEPDRDTFAETDGCVYNFVFMDEDDNVVTITKNGLYELTIRAMYTEELNEEGEVVETIDLPVITATYVIAYPATYVLNPENGSQVDDLQTITLEFPETKNVAFYENNQMPVAVLENTTTGTIFNCQEATRDTFAETDGILFVLNFIEEDAEEIAPIVEDGVYELTVRALYLTDEEGNEESTLPVINATYIIVGSGVDAAEIIGDDTFNIYDLNGVKLVSNGKAEALKSLSKGIYVINGKKVLIRK